MKIGDKVKIINLDNSTVKPEVVPIGSIGFIEDIRSDDVSWHPIAVYIEPHGGWFFDRANLEVI